MASKLYVGNLSYKVTEDDLRALFSQAGQIRAIVIVTDRDMRQPRGFGFVEMTTQAEAEKAIQMFNAHELDGRRLTVNAARLKVERAGGRRTNALKAA